MSSGPSPKRGAPPIHKQSPAPPVRSMLRRSGPQIMVAGLAIGLTYAYFATRAPQPPGTPGMNPLKSQGVKNIEDAYSNAGATTTHTPAYGGTKMGDKSSVSLKEGSASGTGQGDGPGIKNEGMGEDQRPLQPNKVGRAFNDMKYGNESGK